MTDKPFSLTLRENGRKVWETKDEDVGKLFSKNTPKDTINPSLDNTIAELKRKFR